MDLREACDGLCTLFNTLIKAGKAFKPADRSHATAGILVALAAKTERSGIPAHPPQDRAVQCGRRESDDTLALTGPSMLSSMSDPKSTTRILPSWSKSLTESSSMCRQ